MTTTVNVNAAILSSIPIDKDLKRYFIKKYCWVAEHNGLKQASNLFKEMREIALAYRADTHRIERRDVYLQQMPVRKNGWLRKMFDYLDSQPECVLNFLKLYCGLNQPVVSVEESAETQDAYLRSRTAVVDTQVPSYLRAWAQLVKLTARPGESRRRYAFFKHYSNSLFHRFCAHHSFEEWEEYWRKWRRQLYVPSYTDEELIESLRSKEPLPEMYCDARGEDDPKGRSPHSSAALEEDLWNLSAMMSYAEDWGVGPSPTITPKSLNFVLSFLNPDLLDYFDRMVNGECPTFGKMSLLDGMYVGHIHHIPKKGTVKRRPIAAPNRFLQMGMTPAYRVLSDLVGRLERDCTFDQAKMDMRITNRVSNSNLYVGSVDLSQATDNLPFSWGECLWDILVAPRVSELVHDSWTLFRECTRSRWNNDGILSVWTVGQPLGCLPSFMVLALTHNLLLESMSLWQGYGHSPYTILGDDLVIFTKKLRKVYIRELTTRGIPLSLHKSYEGNLTEFAGKTFVKGMLPFHTPDQGAITFPNLFDWQRASGIPIPYDHLPSKVRERIVQEVKRNGIENEGIVPVIYELVQYCYCSSRYLPSFAGEGDLISVFFRELPVDETTRKRWGLPRKPTPDKIMRSGIVNIGGHPVTYLDYGYAEKHGHKQRFRKVTLPDWYKLKFRPVATTQLFHCGCQAVKEIKGV